MAKTYNGRFDQPKQPGKVNGWLIAGIILLLCWPAGMGAFAWIGAICCFGAWSKRDRDKKIYTHFNEYVSLIGMRERVPLRDFARMSNRPITAVRAEIQAMVSRGYFGTGAYIDAKDDALVLPAPDKSEVNYGGNWASIVADVISTLRGDRQAERDAERKAERSVETSYVETNFVKKEPAAQPPQQPQQPKPQTGKMDKQSGYMAELEKTLNELYQLNEKIKDEGVSKRIDRIGQLTAGIFNAIIEKPDREQDVHKFMNYYLPTTLKLLKSYDLLEDQSYQGENIIASRKKIEHVLDMLIDAFEKQLDRLFKNDALDIATDIDVLETMMAGDGYSDKNQMGAH